MFQVPLGCTGFAGRILAEGELQSHREMWGLSHHSDMAQAVSGAQEFLQVSTALPAQGAAALTVLWNLLHPGLCIK